MTIFSEIGEMHEGKDKPQIKAAFIAMDDDDDDDDGKGEMLPLIPTNEEESYYRSIPDGVKYGFMVPPLPTGPPPQYDSAWQPTMNRTHRLSVHIRKASIAILQRTNWWGVLLAFLSGAFFTLSSAAVKALRSIDPMELLIIRSSIQIMVMLPIAVRRGENLLGPKGQRALLQLQGIVGGATLVLLFFSFRRLPLGDATTIIFSSPVFVMIMSFIFLREPCGFFRTLIVFLLLTGVVLISKPPFLFHSSGVVLQTEAEQLDITNFTLAPTEISGNDTSHGPVLFGEAVEEVKNVVKTHDHHHNQASAQHYDIFGYLCAFGATLFTALNIVVMRKCKDVHFSVVVFQLSLWGLIVSGIVFAFLGHHHHEKLAPHGVLEWVLAVVVSILGLSGQVLVAKALGLEGAGRVAVTRSLDIILAFTLQVVAFGEVPDYLSIMGAVFVLVCVLAMGIEEQIMYVFSLIP